MKKRPYVLSLAGHDPSAGAGLQADIKTIEILGGYGLSVCTAVTVQNDIDFEKCHWTPLNTIEDQLHILFKRFEISIVKIGIIENWPILEHILDIIKTRKSEVKIILDPVLSSSTDFSFNKNKLDDSLVSKVLEKVFLVTPNFIEINQLYNVENTLDAIFKIQDKTNLLLKGGHRKEDKGLDELFVKKGTRVPFPPSDQECYPKHGSGCVLSSAIATYLAKGHSLVESCRLGKKYTVNFLGSNMSLLGYHQHEVI